MSTDEELEAMCDGMDIAFKPKPEPSKDKCPGCGADFNYFDNGAYIWKCLSREYHGSFSESVDCLRRQRAKRDKEIAYLNGANDNLAEQLARLTKLIRDGIVFARQDGGSAACRSWAKAAEVAIKEK